MWVSRERWLKLQEKLVELEERVQEALGALPLPEANGSTFTILGHRFDAVRPRVRVCGCGVVFGAPRKQGYRPPPGEACPTCQVELDKKKEAAKWAEENPRAVEEAKLKQFQERYGPPMYFSWKSILDKPVDPKPPIKKAPKRRGKRGAK